MTQPVQPAGFYKDFNYNFLSQSQVDTIDQNICMPAGQAISQLFDPATAIQYVSVVLSSAQILALRANPVTIIPAPGQGYALQLISAFFALRYNSIAYAITNPTDYLNFRYTNGSGVIISDNITPTAFLSATANTYTTARAKVDEIVAASAAGNAAIVLHNSGAAEYTLGNSSMQVHVTYTAHPIGF